MRELDARVSGNTLVVLECEDKFARVRLVNEYEKSELVAMANSGEDALDLFKHPFAMIDRFCATEKINNEFDPDKYIYDADRRELVPK